MSQCMGGLPTCQVAVLYIDINSTGLHVGLYGVLNLSSVSRVSAVVIVVVVRMEKAASGPHGDQKKQGQIASRKKKLERYDGLLQVFGVLWLTVPHCLAAVMQARDGEDPGRQEVPRHLHGYVEQVVTVWMVLKT